jgi:cell division protease FtsH
LGGYASELLRFKELTTGASNDLKRCSALARRIVTEFGMSELGPVTFGQKDEYVFLGKELHEARNYSEATAAKIDEQVSKLIYKARQKAESILATYQDKLALVAHTLIKQETIDRPTFLRLMSDNAQASPQSDEQPSPTTPRTSPLSGTTQPAPAAA